MNADLEQAVAFLGERTTVQVEHLDIVAAPAQLNGEHWEWRSRMADRIASSLDGRQYGVKGLYIFGSTKNGSAGPGSDIDLLVHVQKQEGEETEQLRRWFEGWSLCLAELNFLRTGYRIDALLDVHYVTDEDIARQNSFAMKIGAVTDAARPLRLRSAAEW